MTQWLPPFAFAIGFHLLGGITGNPAARIYPVQGDYERSKESQQSITHR